jgi:hypothetical protein
VSILFGRLQNEKHAHVPNDDAQYAYDANANGTDANDANANDAAYAYEP